MLGFKNFDSASRTIMGIEAMHMIHKNQTWVRSVTDEVELIHQLINVK